MYAVLASSWNLLAGYTGYISLAHAAFFGIGAYSLALWTGPNTASLAGYGPLLLTIPIGLAVGVAALPIGWVILRTRHVTFAIVTITLLFMVQTLAFNLTGLTGGSQGLAVAAPPFPASWFERPFYWAMLILLALCVVIFEAVRRSRLGLSLTALREDEEKARGLGVPTQPLKIGAFAVSVAITAMAGGVWAYYLTFIEPQYAIDPLAHGRHRADRVPRRQGHPVGADDRRAHRGSRAAVLRVPSRRERPVPGLVRGDLPGRDPAAAARRRPVARRVDQGPPGQGSRRVRDRTRPAAARTRRSDPMSETPAGPQAPHPPLLDVRRLHRSFGGVQAVNDCSIAVAPHTITGLIGPNGSGKTTAFNIITGYLAATSGEVRFDGTRHPRPDPRRMYLAGLTRTFQQARVFPELTVLENLVVAARRDARALFGRRVTDRDREQAMDMLGEFNLAEHAAKKASALSYGQRKLLEFAAALIADPRLVMLDEPTAGVNPVMIETMERHIRDRHERGVTFLIVEHDMNFVMRVCDPIIVLNQGAPIVVGPPAQVQTDPRVLEAYLGD